MAQRRRDGWTRARHCGSRLLQPLVSVMKIGTQVSCHSTAPPPPPLRRPVPINHAGPPAPWPPPRRHRPGLSGPPPPPGRAAPDPPPRAGGGEGARVGEGNQGRGEGRCPPGRRGGAPSLFLSVVLRTRKFLEGAAAAAAAAATAAARGPL